MTSRACELCASASPSRQRAGSSPKRSTLSTALKSASATLRSSGSSSRARSTRIAGAETTTYRVLVGIPWRLAWPFSRGEDRVELLRVDWILHDTQYPSVGRESRSHSLQMTAELNREHLLRFRWDDPGQSPQDVCAGHPPGTPHPRRVHLCPRPLRRSRLPDLV